MSEAASVVPVFGTVDPDGSSVVGVGMPGAGSVTDGGTPGGPTGPERSAGAPDPAAPDLQRSAGDPPEPVVLRPDRFATRFRTIHGHRRAYVRAGRGPAMLFIHGIGDSSATWAGILPRFAEGHTVVAPDLLGHGQSDKPRGDYSIAGYASGMRDLLGVLGIERATVVGHSLGAGVAMQFAYQFPERCERVILVAPGGVGRQVSLALRAGTLPGAEVVLSVLTHPRMRPVGRLTVRALELAGTNLGRDADDVVGMFDRLGPGDARRAFLRTLRTSLDWRGQTITMLDRSYLTVAMPTLLIGGDRDAVIPTEHPRIAHEAMPGSRLEIFPGAGHFPHHSDPDRFVAVVEDFLATTQPASYDAQQWRALIRAGRLEATTADAGPSDIGG